MAPDSGNRSARNSRSQLTCLLQAHWRFRGRAVPRHDRPARLALTLPSAHGYDGPLSPAVPARRIPLDAVPRSGVGGVSRGGSRACRLHRRDQCPRCQAASELSQTRIYAAATEPAAPFRASRSACRPVHVRGSRTSFVDGVKGICGLETTWPLLRPIEPIVVSLGEVARAMRAAAEYADVIAQGGRAGSGNIVVGVVSGENIDLSTFASVVGAHP